MKATDADHNATKLLGCITAVVTMIRRAIGEHHRLLLPDLERNLLASLWPSVLGSLVLAIGLALEI